MSQHLKSLGRSSSRPKNPRPSKHFFPPCIHCGFSDHLSDDCVNYPICDICGSYDHDTQGHNRIISLRRGIKPINPKHVMKSCETCGSTVHTTTNQNDIEWFKRGEELQCDIRKPIWYLDSGCSRHMTGVKSYLHKYMEQPRPKVVFKDDSTCTTEGYGSIKCNGIVFTKVAFINGLKNRSHHIDESLDAIKFSKPSLDNINIAKNERYPPDEYLHPYDPSQRYQTNINGVSFIEPYEFPEPVVLETKVSSDQNGQTDQNDHNDQNDQSVQNDEILNDDHFEHSNHTNDEQIIDNLLNT
ncbi:hypothetical protein Tco_0242165 [Tanacetum coccineum]